MGGGRGAWRGARRGSRRCRAPRRGGGGRWPPPLPSPRPNLASSTSHLSAAVLALPASRDPSPGAGLPAAPRLAGAMDGGGEPLLVRRSKDRKKRPAAAAAAHAERDAGAGDRFRSLWRDYNDLVQVSSARARRLLPWHFTLPLCSI